MWVGCSILILIEKYLCVWRACLYYFTHNYGGKDWCGLLFFCCLLALVVKYIISRWFSALFITWILLTIFCFAADHIFSIERMCLWCEVNWNSKILETNNQDDDQGILGKKFYHKLVDAYRGDTLHYMSSYENLVFPTTYVTYVIYFFAFSLINSSLYPYYVFYEWFFFRYGQYIR